MTVPCRAIVWAAKFAHTKPRGSSRKDDEDEGPQTEEAPWPHALNIHDSRSGPVPYAPIIICAARRLPKRLPAQWKAPLNAGRLAILSPFDESVKRATEQTALLRNRLVAALAEKIFVAHAAPGSKTESFCREIASWHRPLYTLDLPENSSLLELGAVPIHSAPFLSG